METRVIGPIQAYKEGWSVVKRNPAPLVTGSAAFILLLKMPGLVPVLWVEWLLLGIITPPLFGGLHVLFLNAARNSNPRLTDLFVGFRRHETLWAGSLLFALIGSLHILVIVFPIVVVLVSMFSTGLLHQLPDSIRWLLIWLLALLPAFAAWKGYAFTLFAAADAHRPRESARLSRSMTKGRGLRTFLTLTTLALAGPVGLLLVGGIVQASEANAYGPPGWVIFWLVAFCSAIIAFAATTAVYCEMVKPASEEQAVMKEAA